MTILLTRLSRAEWRANNIHGRWIADCSLAWGHVWICLLGMEVSVVW